MRKQKILNQISELLGRLLVEVKGDKIATAIVNEMMILVGKFF